MNDLLSIPLIFARTEPTLELWTGDAQARTFGRQMRSFLGLNDESLRARAAHVLIITGVPAYLGYIALMCAHFLHLSAEHGERQAGDVRESLGLTAAHHPDLR